jgi:hypothetical protein
MKNKRASHIMSGVGMIIVCKFEDRIIASLFEF